MILLLILAADGLAAKSRQESTRQAPAAGDEPSVESREVTVDDLVKTALEQNPSIKAARQVGAVDFLTLLDSVITLLDYQLKYYESLTEFQKALAQLEPLVGVELTK